MLIWQPSLEQVESIRTILRAFNQPHFQGATQDTCLLTVDDDGDLSKGGAYVTFFGHILEIKYLVVESSLRNQSYGSKLILEIEALAHARGMKKMTLNTYSFQAKTFYEKHGFKVLYEIEGYPNGIIKHYMEKTIL